MLGPRQSGKTTLAQLYCEANNIPFHYLDLENPNDFELLRNPLLTLESFKGLIIIDEIQRMPSLCPALRHLVDHKELRFLILGSASVDLVKHSSETLAGRIGHIEVMPFDLTEVGDVQKLLYRGGFPKSFLAPEDEDSFNWRENYIRTFLEQDISNLGLRISATTLRRFWMMIAHWHGQMINLTEIGKSLGLSAHTVRHYLEILEGTFMIRLLQPWHENISKRHIKTPKIYIRDSGIIMSILNIYNQKGLLYYPRLGAIWEGFALEQIIETHHFFGR